MALVSVIITVTTIGADAGPFTVSDGLGNTYSGVTRSMLLAGYLNQFDDTATNITVTSTGVCTNSLSIPFSVPVSPTPAASVSVTPTVTVTPTITPTNSPAPGASLTPTPTVTPSVTETPIVTATPSVTVTPTITETPSITVSPSITPTPTISETPSITPSVTPSPNLFRNRAQVNAISIVSSTFVIGNNTPGGTTNTVVGSNTPGTNVANDAYVPGGGVTTTVQYYVDKTSGGGIASDPTSVILIVNGVNQDIVNFNTGDVIAAVLTGNILSSDPVQILIQEG
jgi:hypothetical protein